MKKKIQKPLKLNRETLTSLCHSDLREPVGMATGLPNACDTVRMHGRNRGDVRRDQHPMRRLVS